MKIPEIQLQLAKRVTLHFFLVFFVAVGMASTLAIVTTAKWYGVLFAIILVTCGWYSLYKFEEGWAARKLQSE